MVWNERFTQSVNDVALDIQEEAKLAGVNVVECGAEDLAGGFWAFRLEWLTPSGETMTLWTGPDEDPENEDGFYWQYGNGTETGPDQTGGAAGGAQGEFGTVPDWAEVDRVLMVGSESTRFARWIARKALEGNR